MAYLNMLNLISIVTGSICCFIAYLIIIDIFEAIIFTIAMPMATIGHN